jgi:DNA polymerase-1
LQEVYLMTIRKPVNYLKMAKRLTAQRRDGTIASPAPSIPSRRSDAVRQEAPEPALEPSGYKGTRKYALITEADALSDLVTVLEDVREVAFDVETYPLDDSNTALDPRRGRVRLISVAAEDGIGGVVDVTKVHPGPLLETFKNKTLIAHNAKFELSYLKNQFCYEHDGPVVDTTILDTILYYAAGPRKRLPGWLGFPRDEDRRRSLKDVAADFIGAELDKEEQTSDFGLEDLTDAQLRYSLQDAEILIPLKQAMMERLRELGLEKVADLEARFLPALAYCENNGFALDTEGWREQAILVKEDAERLWAQCNALAPEPSGEGRKEWNWRSGKQVGEVFELLGVRLPKTEKGNYKTAEAVLKGVSSPKDAAHLAETILKYREANYRASLGREWFEPPKKKGKKFDKDHQFVVEGRVYASFGQVIKTGRMRCSRPNLQGLPPEFRRYFVAPPGRKLIVADYKNIELVLVGVVAGEDKLLEAFRRGEDVHSSTARGMLESDPKRAGCLATDEEVKEFRPVAKLVSFSILYGSGAKGLAEDMTNKVGVPTTKEEVQVLMSNFFQAYPRLKRWYVKEHAKAKAGDERSRTLSGRLRLLDKEYRRGKWRVKPQLRLNTPIQGSAGDGFKYAVALLWERRRECSGDPKAVNLVHDEIVVEIDEEHVEAGKIWLERCMIDGMAEVAGPAVPVAAEICVNDRWEKP